MTCNETVEQNDPDYEEYGEIMMPDNLPEEIEQLKSQKKPNLEETNVIILGSKENVKENRINIHLEVEHKEETVELLRQYIDVFVWSYDDMPGLSIDIVSHQLPIEPARSPVKQKPRKFKPDFSLRIKEEVTKKIEANVVRVTNYPTWLANIVPVPKKYGKIRICKANRSNSSAVKFLSYASSGTWKDFGT
nr:uncharacterized protein LOC117275521 [Nicotiana tomentosiformis]